MLNCPNCATARAVRSIAFDDTFWSNLAILALPLALTALISALLYRIGLPSPSPANPKELENTSP